MEITPSAVLKQPVSILEFLNSVAESAFEKMERGCVVLDQPQHAMKSRLIMLAPSAAAGLRHSRAPFLKQALSFQIIGWRNGEGAPSSWQCPARPPIRRRSPRALPPVQNAED
jgi:hypothetical protein